MKHRSAFMISLLSTVTVLAEESHDKEEHTHTRSEHEGGHPGVHIHGRGEINISIEEGVVTIYLQTTAFDTIGFEHIPQNDEEQRKLDEALTLLHSPSKLFQINGAICAPSPNLAVATPSHETDHNDIAVEYTFMCRDSQYPTSIDVTVFDVFPSITGLNAIWLSDRVDGPRMGTQQLTGSSHLIALE